MISWWSSTLRTSQNTLKKQWKRHEQAVDMGKVRKLCAIVMYLNAQKELAGEAPHLEHHRTRWKCSQKAMNCRNVESAPSVCCIGWWSSTLRTSQNTLTKQWKRNEQAAEMWEVRKLCAIVMYLNAQKQWLAGEAPHLEHRRTRWKSNTRQCTSSRHVESGRNVCYNDVP